MLSGLTITSHGFDPGGFEHSLMILTSKNIYQSFDPEDIVIASLNDGTFIPDENKTVFPVTGNYTSVVLSPMLSDGNYESDILASGIVASDGSTLDGDAYASFFHLGGDINRDRVIDMSDYDMWYACYGFAGLGYGGGDLNYDGVTNEADYDILASKFGTTLEEPPTTTNAYSTFTQGSSKIHLQWNAAAEEVEGYIVSRSLDGVSFNEIGRTSDTFFDDNGLSDGTKYWYRVKPYIGDFYTGPSMGRVWSVTTLPAPSNLQISAVTDKQMTLTWQDNSTGETGFQIQRAIGEGAFTPFANVGANTTSFTANNLSENTSYRWRVIARASAADSIPTIEQNETTKLKAPVNVTATTVNASAVDLSWTSQTAAAAEIVLSVSFDGADFVEFKRFAPGTSSTRYHSPKSATTQFRIASATSTNTSMVAPAKDAQGNVAQPSLISALQAPIGLDSASAWIDGVTLSWQPTSYADYYLIEWSSDNDFLPIGDADGGSFLDLHPALGTQYYRVRGVIHGDQAYSSPASSPLSVTPIAPPVARYDDNGGPNQYGNLSWLSISHSNIAGLTIAPRINDTSHDQGPLTILPGGFTNPQHGSVTWNQQSGLFTYVPAGDFFGIDSFEYVVNNGIVNSEPARVEINVTNAVPIATPLDLQTGPQLGNGYREPLKSALGAYDADGDALTYRVEDEPVFGTVEIDPSGEFEYLPSNYDAFPGSDSFTFIVSDGLSESVPTTVSIEVALNRVNGQVYHFGDQYMFDWSVLSGPQRGTITTTPPSGGNNPPPAGFTYPEMTGVSYSASGNPLYDVMSIKTRIGDFTSKPVNVVYLGNNWPTGAWPHFAGGGQFSASAYNQTSYSNAETLFKPNGYQGQLALGESPAHGSIVFPGDGSFTFTPQGVDEGEKPYIGLDYFSIEYTQPDGLQSETWIELVIGENLARPPVIVSQPQSDWSTTPFNGTLEQLNSKLSVVRTKRDEVYRKLELLGQAWKTVNENSGKPAAEILTHADHAVDALDAVQSAYLTYQDSWLELMGNAKQYQTTYQAYFDNWMNPTGYAEIVAGILSMPRDIGGLQANSIYLTKITDAVNGFGEGASIQSNIAGTVFITATYTHKVLDTAEYALGLGTGGTYTVAALSTKAGLAALAKTVARNYVVGEIAEAAVTPVISGALSLAAQANINVDPNLVRAGMLALQATGAIKAIRRPNAALIKSDPVGSAANIIKGGLKRSTERGELRRRFIATHGEDAFQNGKTAHHMIPVAIVDDPDVAFILAKAAKADWDFSAPLTNGAITKQYHGPHNTYSDDVKDWLKDEMKTRKKKGKLKANSDYATLLNECVANFRPKLGPVYDLLP